MRIRTALRQFDWKSWLGWIAATMVGVQLGILILFVAGEVNLPETWWGSLITVSLAGISLGVCQWIWLRRRLVNRGWWVLSTLSGWYLGWILMILLGLSSGPGALSRLIAVVEPLAIPLAFSLPQWVFIRRQFQKAAWLWIVARPLAWIAGIGLMALAQQPNILRLDFFGSSSVLGIDVPELVVYSIIAAIFGSDTQLSRAPRSFG